MTDWSGYLPSEKASAINRERQATYGDPVENYRIFGELISPILGVKVSPCQAAMIVLQLKVMREHCGGYVMGYNDNLEDICGFANVLYKVKGRYGSTGNTSRAQGMDSAQLSRGDPMAGTGGHGGRTRGDIPSSAEERAEDTFGGH